MLVLAVSSTEFQRHFGRYQTEAKREPVEITCHGRREFVFMTADQFRWLNAAAHRVGRTSDAPSFVVEAVERAEMDPEQQHLDELMK
ncbi:type II toxin-antitoxin system prevent-host-death family antitoxin [Tepidicaulis sp. LMO-SS28]|uniref:type II toxin-antitoxin system prevent-host-death family antitoxin n=1 Tax=Tepidicaulis sp. LMO-SS28 TaxID=3447455 RepID=UPI003EDF267B